MMIKKYITSTFNEFLNENAAAENKIDSLPRGKTFDDAKRIDGIFSISKHSWSDVVNTFEKNENSARVGYVNIKDIRITQPSIQSNKVKKMMSDIDNTPIINVVQFADGEQAIYDGHHRLIANWALGENKIKANIVKL